MASRRSRYLAILTSVALLGPATPVAWAGPDDGKHLATKTHVDSPKTFWENNRFALKSEYGDNLTPTQDTVAWIGKGWARTFDGTDGENQYQFTLPDNGAFDFFGKAGQTFYSAPQGTKGGNNPIWLGFGADAALPSKDFKEGTAALDLLAVEGPGEVEMFRYYDSPEGAGLERLLGTTPSSPRSAHLTAGSHTHNYTLFSKPGRYVLTYRTTARALDGSLIASEPVRASLQVGGAQPLDKPTPSLKERYDAAPAGDAARAGYRLSLAPKADQTRDGDDKLTTFTFESDTPTNGTLTLLNDGYFLTDLPVKDGKAQWDEFLGPEDSSIQAAYTPDQSEAGGARWISQPVQYTAGGSTATDSTKAAATWEDNSGTERPLAGTQIHDVTAPGIKARIEPAGDYAAKLIVETEDPDFAGFVRGGFYESKDDNSPYMDVMGEIHNGRAEINIDYGTENNGYVGRFRILPHPRMNATGTELVLGEKYEFGKTYELSGKLDPPGDKPGTAPSTEPSTEPKPSPQPSPEPEKPRDGVCDSRILLDQGHVDIAAQLQGKNLSLVLKDETNIAHHGATERRLDEVTFAVPDHARMTRNARMKDPALDFLGAQGSKFYLLPQVQKQSLVWPGYNTQKVDFTKLQGPVHLNLKPVSVPGGAAWGLFTDNGMGKIDTLVDSTKDDYSLEATFATHTHVNWAFTKPGLYQLAVNYSATSADGTELASEPQVLTVAVGDAAVRDCTPQDSPSETPKPSQDPKPSQEPKPSEEPSPSTKPTPSEEPKPSQEPKPTDKPKPSPQPQPTPQPDNPGKPDDAGSSASGLAFAWILPVVFAGIVAAFAGFFHDYRDRIGEILHHLLRGQR